MKIYLILIYSVNVGITYWNDIKCRSYTKLHNVLFIPALRTVNRLNVNEVSLSSAILTDKDFRRGICVFTKAKRKRNILWKTPKECLNVPWWSTRHFLYKWLWWNTHNCFFVITLFSFIIKPAYSTTNTILYWDRKTVLSDHELHVLLMATSWIYTPESPMRFSEILTLKQEMFFEITKATEHQWNPRGQIRTRVQRLCEVITGKRRGR